MSDAPCYRDPEEKEITDAAIQTAFRLAAVIDFSARPFNTIRYRSIAFGNLGWWIPLKRVLPLIGVTPPMLREVFHRGEPAETYEALGSFTLAQDNFVALAKVLGKPIRVMRQDGATGDHRLLFTALPTGVIA